MKVETFEDLVDSLVLEVRQRLHSKGEQYAPGEDRLSSFKKGASVVGLNSMQFCIALATKHFVRLAELMEEPEKASREDVLECLGDILAYGFLLWGLYNEVKLEEQKEG